MKAAEIVAGLTLAALALTACGAAETGVSVEPTPLSQPSQDTQTKPEPAPSNNPEPPPADSVLPAVDLLEVATGADVPFAGLVPSEKPILLWAWAPHCAICAGEAAGVEEFAKANSRDINVVGIGTQDSLELAEDFVATHNLQQTRMLWDTGFESWRALRITGQPTWVLISPQGEEIERWQGGLPTDEILAQLA